MSEVLGIGEPPIPVTLRRNARSRRLTLRLSASTGEATLTLPPALPLATARDFLEEKEPWLRARWSGLPQAVLPEPGDQLPLLGQEVALEAGSGRGVVQAGQVLRVPGQGADFRRRLVAWLKHRARDEIAARTDRYAAQLDRRVTRLSLRDTRSRWGSCTEDGRLMFSWRLVMAPEAVLDYVVAHEVAHLEEMNHSPAFWRVVEGLRPDYRDWRGWLRVHGAELHRYRFSE